MKTAIAWLMLLALVGFGVGAQARLTPYQGTHRAADASATAHGSLETFGPTSARLERNYFQAPPAPPPAQPVGRCTVSIFVFSKIRLAQACY